MDQPHQIDPAAIERLRRLGGDEFVLKMTNLFLSYVSQKIEEARQALKSADLAGVAKAAHAIKIKLRNVGALGVQDSARASNRCHRNPKAIQPQL
jgi:HPt (histidine-containing phosphotransfer) domain-containing protein